MRLKLRSDAPARRNKMRGFGLVEVMVAAVIGMLTVLVIMQSIAATEAQRRQTTGGNSADAAGALALQTIQRSMYGAGAGMTGDINNIFATCFAATVVGNNNVAGGPGDFTFPVGTFAPFMVWPAAAVPAHLNAAGFDANTDVIQVIGGGSDFFLGAAVTGGTLTWGARSYTVVPGTASAFPIGGLHAGDMALLVQAGQPCRIAQITYVSNRGQNVVGETGCYDPSSTAVNTVEARFGTAAFNSFYEGCASRTSNWNVEPGVGIVGTAWQIYSLGQPERFMVRAYGVRNGRLTACAPLYRDCTDTANWEIFADGVVSLKAELGWDSDGTPGLAAAEWVRTPPVAAPTGLQWAGLRSVRVALVARNKTMERDVITGAVCSPAWSGAAAANATCAGVIGASQVWLLTGQDGANWDRYRYKIFETAVQLRNMYWQ